MGSRKTFASLIVYAGVQGLAYALDCGIFGALVYGVDAPADVANLASKGLSGLFGYLSHRYVTFQTHKSAFIIGEFVRFTLALAVNSVAATVLLIALSSVIEPLFLAKFLADLACVLLSFVIAKYLVFRSSRADDTVAADMVDRS